MASEVGEANSAKPAALKSENEEQKKGSVETKAASGEQAVADSGEPKLSAAEEKKRKKAEKQAKRAQEKAGRPGGDAAPAGPAAAGGQKSSPSGGNAASSAPNHGGSRQSRPAQDTQRRGQASRPAGPERGGEVPVPAQSTKAVKKPTKEWQPFGDFAARKRPTVADAAKEVHPAVFALGFQMAHYVVCGSTARSIAMLQAFKAVIESYTTPPGTSFARHFTAHHLAKQIDFLVSCRPLAVPMGNSIRFLKDLVIREDPSKSEVDTKRDLKRYLNEFIQERFTAASTMIAQSTSERIHNNDVVVTYGGSSVVKEALLTAHSKGKVFSVFCVDSQPLKEGSNLALALQSAGIKVTIARINSLTRLMRKANIILLGATAMTGNGALYARAGSAAVATIGNYYKVPVLVLCQTIKFTEKPIVHGLEMNENAPGEELVMKQSPEPDSFDPVTGGLIRVDKWAMWKEKENVKVLNLLYDLTPAECIQGVICEHAIIPPSAVPAMLRLSGGPAQGS